MRANLGYPERITEVVDGVTWARRRGIVRFADGTEHSALLHFCESDSNEHYGTEILFESPCGSRAALVRLDGEPETLRELGKTRAQVFPYKYKYEGPACVDHHIGDDGWSR